MGDANDSNRAFFVGSSSRLLVAIGSAFLALVLAHAATDGEWGLPTFFAASSACVLMVDGFLRGRRPNPAGPEQIRRLYLAYVLVNGTVFAVAAIVLAADVIADGGSATKTVELVATGLVAVMLLSIALLEFRHTRPTRQGGDRTATEKRAR